MSGEKRTLEFEAILNLLEQKLPKEEMDELNADLQYNVPIEKSKVTILGAGNGGQTLAFDLIQRKVCNVTLYDRTGKFKNNQFNACFETPLIEAKGALEGKVMLTKITKDFEVAVKDADIVFIVAPAAAHKYYAEEFEKLADEKFKDGLIIVLMPGSLGSLHFKKVLGEKAQKKDLVICETSSLLYDTRLAGNGKLEVFCRNSDLLFATLPKNKLDFAFEKVSKLFEGVLDNDQQSFVKSEDVLHCGLHSLNPVLHLPGCILNAGRIESSRGEFYLYAEGITPAVCKVMEKFDLERKVLVEKIYDVSKPGAKFISLAEELAEGRAPRTLWAEVNGCITLEPIKGPTELTSRYFTEDIPFGLTAWIELADLLNVKVPIMKSLKKLGGIVSGLEDEGQIGKVTYRTLDDMGLSVIKEKPNEERVRAIKAYVTEW